MGSITFIEHDGNEHKVEIEEGRTLMQTAADNLVPGLDGDCGGECACGTCHVIVEKDWVSRVGSASDTEEQMLDMTPEKEDTSRLSCQIPVTEEMDGLVVRIPEFQM